MADDDRYTRITLRIPKDLIAPLKGAADARSHSMNAEIVHRLEKSFSSENLPWIAQAQRENLEFQLFQAESKLKWIAQKWNERLKNGIELGNIEAIMYETDVATLEDTIMFLKDRLSAV